MGVQHYARVEDPVAAILSSIGRDHDITIDDLAPVDEFHLGGAAATAALVADLDLRSGDRVLDIGCGIGGPARRMASIAGCDVLGVDLTPSFVTTATALSELTGLGDRTEFAVGDATRLELDGSFDAATLVHVGMNIADKAGFFAAIADRLEPGCRFGVYDIMAIGDPAELAYPMPFATSADDAWVESPQTYPTALAAAGFTVSAPVDRTRLALDAAAAAAASGPPPVSLATLMGPDFGAMFANLGAAIRAGLVAPVQIVATR
ncbi:MAG: methyltransferase domain-containing protein [Actinomycetota bacterium]